MRWLKRIAIGLGVILALALLAGVGIMIWKPWVPAIEMSEPGPTGRRIATGGVLGNYYPGAGGGRRPGILLLGGSEGALGRGSTRIALGLQAAGFSVLQLSYFRGPGQTEALALVPLERFDRGLACLKAQPQVDPARIAVVGASKGGEAALLVGTRHPELRAVAAGMPSSVVWPGVDWHSLSGETRSSWSRGGRPVPALPYGEGSFFSGDIAAIYRNGLKALPQHQQALIPVERGTFPILLICGEADTLWPSCPMARQVKAAASARVEMLAYPQAGHGVFGRPAEGDIKSLAGMGGTPEGNQAARRDSWPRLIAFLITAFR